MIAGVRFTTPSPLSRQPNGPHGNFWKPSPGIARRYLLRDRDGAYQQEFSETAKRMGIQEVQTAPRSPWVEVPQVDGLHSTVRLKAQLQGVVSSLRPPDPT